MTTADAPENRAPLLVDVPSKDDRPWNKFPLGVTSDGHELCWDAVEHPSLLVSGPVGSGKTTTLQTVVSHALLFPPEWRVVALDPGGDDMGWLRGRAGVDVVVSGVSDASGSRREWPNLEEMVACLENVSRDIGSRQAKADTCATTGTPRLLVVVDEVWSLIAPSLRHLVAAEDEVARGIRARARNLLRGIATHGGPVGVHLACATQEPDENTFPEGAAAWFGARIATGRTAAGPSTLFVGSDAATRLPDLSGYALARTGDDLVEFLPHHLAGAVLDVFQPWNTPVRRGRPGAGTWAEASHPGTAR